MSSLGRKLAYALAASALFFAVPSQGAAQGFLLDAYAGIGIPGSGLSDFQKTGFSGGIGLGYLFGNRLGFRGDLAGEFLKGEEPSVTIPIEPPVSSSTDVKLYHYDAAFMVNLTDPTTTNFVVALDAGAGFTTISFSDGGPENTTRFTVPVGIGLGYLVSSNVGIFVRGRWYLMFTKKDDFGKSTWSTFPIWAGIGIRP